MDETINFICPVCSKKVKEEEADNIVFSMEDMSMYHISCLNEKQGDEK